jgi:hypothetical protein
MHQHPGILVMIVMILITGAAGAAEPEVLSADGISPSSDFSDSALGDEAQWAGPCAIQGADSRGGTESDRSVDLINPSGRDDRMWVLSTRHLSPDVCNADVRNADFRVARMDVCGNRQSEAFDHFLSQLVPGRPVVVHVHGNRMTEADANSRGRFVYHQVARYLGGQPIDFLIFSWPSEKTGVLIRDGRDKAEMTEAEGLYFAILLRELLAREVPITVVAYSFGCRVATGGLHTLAGGTLSGRGIPGEPIRNSGITVGLVAPALEADWLARGQYHGLASQNISRLAILYNPRDAILKRYWLIDSATRGRALGYTGPKRIAVGYDGRPIPLTTRDCSPFLGLRHSEMEYYCLGCGGASTMARLIKSVSPQ